MHDDGDLMTASENRRDPLTRDAGSVLPIILAFMVIGSLIIIPMLTYASTVLRANSVSVQKTENMEHLRAGARVAAADPADLFVRCSGATAPIPVAGALVAGTQSSCSMLEDITVLNELEVPYGGVAMQLGETVPTAFSYSKAQPNTGDPVNWYGDPTDTSCTTPQRWCPDPKQDTIWIPPLPEVATSFQEATGYPMPPPRDCTVYFPGTYNDPIVIDRPTYFVSGVYLFNETVTVVGGADAVFGFGLAEGCVGNDSAAVLDMYPNPLPPDLNAEGNGATLLFADEAQLIIDDGLMTDDPVTRNIVPNTAGKTIRFEVNQRYIKDVSDTAARVSIMSINGDRDVDTTTTPETVTYGSLDVPDVITSAESVVKTSTGDLVKASTKGLEPSSLTAEPRAPETPRNVQALSLDDDYMGNGWGAARISWDPPVGNDEGGSTITRYEVTEATHTGLACHTDGATSCVIRNLQHNVNYFFSVTAINDVGASEPSLPATATTKPESPNLKEPGAPTDVTVDDPIATTDPYDSAVKVSWTAPTDDGNALLIGYQVAAYPVYEVFEDGVSVGPTVDTTAPAGTCEVGAFRDQPAATSCVVTGLAPLDLTPGLGPVSDLVAIPQITSNWVGYTFEVTAVNAITNQGLPFTAPDPSWIVDSTSAALTDPPVQTVTGAGTTAYVPPADPTWPIAPVYVPDPIVDVDLSNTAVTGSKVTIAGYIATPQGRVRVSNPDGERVTLNGGVVAGSFDIDAATAATMGDPYSPTTVGFEDVVLQRKIRIVTTLGGTHLTSTIVAQINANGADMRINSWVIE